MNEFLRYVNKFEEIQKFYEKNDLKNLNENHIKNKIK
jgi:hypothetical protein